MNFAVLHLWWVCGSGLNYERNWNWAKPSVTLWWWTFIVFLPLLLMTRLLSCFLNIWTLMLQILSTVSKSFSASDSLKNEPGKQPLMIIVSEYAGKLPIRLIPLWLNMPKEIKRAEWRKKRECWSICHLICTYAIAGCHSTKMLIRFAASLLRIKIFFYYILWRGSFLYVNNTIFFYLNMS